MRSRASAADRDAAAAFEAAARTARLGAWAAALAAFVTAGPAHAADPAAGRAKSAPCAVCHGAAGISQAPDAPNLAGQPEIYLAAQLKAYRAGRRKHEVMEVIARDLKDDDIDDLAAWYASIRIRAEPP